MAVASASFFVHYIYMAFSVGAARKKYGVKYPDLYANKDNCPKEEDAKAFNCIQRGHQNSLEFQPIILVLLVCAGLKHPLVAAVGGVVALVGRVVYFTGYSTGVPKNRMRGLQITILGVLTLQMVIFKSVAVWAASLMG
eukprot:jgi/Ulvmu1/3243/UM150_0016.1